MIKLEDLRSGMRVSGIRDNSIVEIIQVTLQTSDFAALDDVILSANVVYKLDDGAYGDQTLFRKNEAQLKEARNFYVFGRKAELARLAWQARRIQSAHLFDPYHEVFASNIDVLPHQIEAVYGNMLGRQPLRFLLADDPGAGKTIMAGLYLREMMARASVKRCLIVAPAGLLEQWRVELWDKFRLRFEPFQRDMLKSDPELREHDLLIAKMDQLKRQNYLEQLPKSEWDLVICDEAHKMSASYSGGEVTRTQRYRLAETLSGITRHFLLMTATPHNGKAEEFQLFLRLLDPDRYERRGRQVKFKKDELHEMKFFLGRNMPYYNQYVYTPTNHYHPHRIYMHSRDVSDNLKILKSRRDILLSLYKGWRNRELAATDIFEEKFLEEDGESEETMTERIEKDINSLKSIISAAEALEQVNSPSAQDRQIDTADVVLRRMKEQLVTLDSKPLYPERKAYTVNYSLSDQERELYKAVTTYCKEEFDRAERLESGHKTNVGFALTVLQRRLASSPEAIYQSLKSRRERLQNRLDEGHESATEEQKNSLFSEDELEDMAAEEREKHEAEVSDRASAASSLEELEKEIETLRGLEAQANEVRKSDSDSKWEKLREIWQRHIPEMEKDGQQRKLIIFTEHRATLDYLVDKLGRLLGDANSVVTIHGGIAQDQRRRVQDEFCHKPTVQILVATDAAGEGINLQFAHLMVNYDLPWNPNRLEQRFGRIHRIGQTEVCHLWNIVTSETREGSVYERLLQKLETIGNDLNGKVFDILGELFEGKPLSELLRNALRYGDEPDVRERLHQTIDNAVNPERIRELTQERVLATDLIDVGQLNARMQAAGADRLRPDDIRDFLYSAFEYAAPDDFHIHKRGRDYYEIVNVPVVIRRYARQNYIDIEHFYKRVYFDQALTSSQNGYSRPELIDTDHPLLEATMGWLKDQFSQRDNSEVPVFLDITTASAEPRVLFYLVWSIQNGEAKNNIIERQAHWVKMAADGKAIEVKAASIQNYRALEKQHQASIAQALNQGWLLEPSGKARAQAYVAEYCVKPHRDAVEQRELRRLETEKRQVEECLRAEINYEQMLEWKYQWQEAKQENAAAFRGLKAQAQQRRQALEERLERRMRQYAQQSQISASGITVRKVAVIIPASLLRT